jgi:hypothetical protein
MKKIVFATLFVLSAACDDEGEHRRQSGGGEGAGQPSGGTTGSGSGAGNEGGSGGGGAVAKTPQQACEDTANAMAAAGVRCDAGDAAEIYEAFLNQVAGGACSNIVRVRDMDALYGTCLPSLPGLSCEDLFAANIDPSCAGQLIR